MAPNEDCTNVWHHFVVILGYSCLKSTTQSGQVSFWCVCDVVVGSCLFFLSLSSVTWQSGWLSHMPWGRVTKLTLGTGRVLEDQTWSCGLCMISLYSLSFGYPCKTLNTDKLPRDHSGGFACYSPLNANCLYCTLLPFSETYHTFLDWFSNFQAASGFHWF